MKTVKEILQNKSNTIFSADRKVSVYQALELMMEKNISAVLVIENETLLGIFTERDYARKVILQGKSSKNTPIEEVMTSKLLTVSLNDNIDFCMKLMTDAHIRHLPVIENGKVFGMVSIGDVVKNIIEVQKNTIEVLESYISG